MKFRLTKGTVIASHGADVVFQDSHSQLFDMSLDADVQLALLQVLYGQTDSQDPVYDEVRGQLLTVLDQLEQNGLVVESANPDPSKVTYYACDDVIIGCLGARSARAIAIVTEGALLEPTNTVNSARVNLFFTDSALRLAATGVDRDRSQSFTVVEISSEILIVSPALGGKSPVTLTAWTTRRLAASWWSTQLDQRLKYFFPDDPPLELSDEHVYFLRKTIQSRCKEGVPTQLEERFDPNDGVRTSLVLPIPSLHTPARPSLNPEEDDKGIIVTVDTLQSNLVSPDVGVVRELNRLTPQPWWPIGLEVVEAKISDIEGVLGWPADRIAAGAAWNRSDLAVASALGEAAERYSGNAIPEDGYEQGSYTDLSARKLLALDPESFALFSSQQYSADGFPFVPFTRELPCDWIWGRSLVSGKDVLAPAQLTYVNWYYSKDRTSPTNVTMFAGIAAGPNRYFAEVSALEELIERDAAHMWWHGRLESKRLDFSSQSSVFECMQRFGSEWDYRLISIPSATGVPVVGCLLLHKVDQLVSLGIASRLNAEIAALKAIAEAVQLHDYARGLLDEEGVIWCAVRDHMITGKNLKPIRNDRNYLESYRPDFRDVVDLPCQMQLYLDPKAHSFIEPLWDVEERVTCEELSIPHDGLQESREILLQRVEGEASDIVSVDLTTSDIRSIGLRVVRVLAPGFYGNSPTAFPYFGGQRLKRELSSRGLDLADWERNLRLEPPPYA